MTNWHDVLWAEHNFEEGSFIYKLRCEPGWDKEAFSRLFNAMHACCQELQGNDSIPRWIADLFWYLDWYVAADNERQWDKLESVPPYYSNAAVNLNHLADSLFSDQPRSLTGYEPLDEE